MLANTCDGAHRVVFHVGIKRRDQLPRHHLIELLLIRRQRAGPAPGGDDGMVVGELCVVIDPFAGIDRLVRREHQRAQRLRHSLQNSLHLGAHIVGKIARIGARIGQQLVLFIQRLRQVQRFLRGKAVARVGLALQGRQIIQQRRRHALALGGNLQHLALPPRHGGHNLLGRLFVRDAGFAVFVDPCAAVSAEIRLHLPIVFRHEIADFQRALDQNRQRGGLHAPDGEQAVVPQRKGARAVHAHQPVRVRPAQSRGIEPVVIRAVPEVGKALRNGFLGHGRNPQPPEGLSASRHLIDAAEDQLALAPCIGGADHAVHLRRVQNRLDTLKLVARLGDDLERDVFRQHGQRVLPPGLPARVDLLRVDLRHQMPHRPCHHIAAALETPLARRVRAEHPRDIPRHRRLFGQYADHSHRAKTPSAGLPARFPHSSLPPPLYHLSPSPAKSPPQDRLSWLPLVGRKAAGTRTFQLVD